MLRLKRNISFMKIEGQTDKHMAAIIQFPRPLLMWQFANQFQADVLISWNFFQ